MPHSKLYAWIFVVLFVFATAQAMVEFAGILDSAYWVGFVTDVPTAVARPLIHGLKNPVVVTDDSIRDHVEVDLTPFDEAVRTALCRKAAADDAPVPDADGDGPAAERGVPDSDGSVGDGPVGEEPAAGEWSRS